MRASRENQKDGRVASLLLEAKALLPSLPSKLSAQLRAQNVKKRRSKRKTKAKQSKKKTREGGTRRNARKRRVQAKTKRKKKVVVCDEKEGKADGEGR